MSDLYYIRQYLALCFSIWLLCGIITLCIAGSKNRNRIAWFFIGFFFGIIGLIIAICIYPLPETKEEITSNPSLKSQNLTKESSIKLPKSNTQSLNVSSLINLKYLYEENLITEDEYKTAIQIILKK